MTLADRVNGDDLAFLALVWLALCFGAGALYVWAMRRWEKYAREMERRRRYVLDRDPDERLHRAGSIHDFRGRMQRSRYP